jgi:putative endonuclease
MWYIYILRSLKDNQLYIGMTNDLRERFRLHNLGKVPATQFRRPFEIIYFEGHHNKYDAAAREQFLKTGWGKNWIKKTLSNFLKSKKLGG